ncbi:MAG TPA: hypothetical protein VHB79_17350, partial [Polyangiaceae bacterium]|nr:hypothetical protein [Polyangiaceae bacterium]
MTDDRHQVEAAEEEPATTPAPEAEADADEEVDELTAATRERDAYLDALQRLKAEFDNYRKRVARDQSDLV